MKKRNIFNIIFVLLLAGIISMVFLACDENDGDNSNKNSGKNGGENEETAFLVRQAVATRNGIIVIKKDGSLWAIGLNGFGQLGNGTTSSISNFTKIGSDTWSSVSSSTSNHVLGIKSDGSLWAWGRNEYSQLGDGTAVNKNIPTRIGTDTNWKSVFAGYDNHSFAIKLNNQLWGWGANYIGQIGDGTTGSFIDPSTNKSSPVQVGSNTWTSISAGDGFTVAIRSDSTLWTWGRNEDGILGDGTTEPKNIPTQIGTDTWKSMSAGAWHVVAIRSDGSLWAWGDNAPNGVLGGGTNGSSGNKNVPTQIGTDTNWVSVSASGQHNMAIKQDGSLWGWGSNFNGQLGDGTSGLSEGKNVPTRIGTETNWLSVTAGAHFTIAIKKDETLWVWGANNAGQLGNLVESPLSSIPVRVELP